MHIFYIHSHITYVVSLLYIEEQKLSKENIGFITSRSYKINSVENVYDISSFYEYLEKNSKYNKIIGLKNKIKHIDYDLKLLANNSLFTIYLPQFNNSIFQILATHPLCAQTVLIEEGITSYKRDKKLYCPVKRNLKQILSRLFSKRFIVNNSHYHPYPMHKFKKALCIDTNCFPYLNLINKHILEVSDFIYPNYKYKIENLSIVFLLDSFKERTQIDNETYFSIVKGTLELLKENKNRLFVKFHPEQSNKIVNKTLSFIKETFNFEEIIELSNDCILEVEFLKLNNLTVIGMHTSSLFYAKKLGHTVFSSIKLTSKISEINNYIDHIMDKDQKEEYMSYE